MQKILKGQKSAKTVKYGSAAKTCIAVVITIFFCTSMTIYADSIRGFERMINLLMFLCIAYSVAAIIVKRKIIHKDIAVMILLYFITRIISYRMNGLHITYGGNMMLQAFYLIGISRFIFAGKKQIKAALYTFAVFDTGALFLCWYNFRFRNEYAMQMYQAYWKKGMIPEISAFQNPNYAGMMAGATIVICAAALANKKTKKITKLISIPVLIFNLYMLFVYTGCRSAQTGLVIVAALAVMIVLIKRTDSVRAIVGVSLIIGFISLIPLYALVYWGDNEYYLDDTTAAEQLLEDVSSERYAIWKTTILSQKGHVLFGYGNISTAISKKEQLVEEFPADRVSDIYLTSLKFSRQHNGYLALMNETGIAGTICLLIVLLLKVKRLKGGFRNNQWEMMLLVYIFWINIFEAKLILVNFFTGLLMMLLLLPTEENGSIYDE